MIQTLGANYTCVILTVQRVVIHAQCCLSLVTVHSHICTLHATMQCAHEQPSCLRKKYDNTLNLSLCTADDYDHGYGNNYNFDYGRGYYGDNDGNFQYSSASAAASASSSGGSAAAAASASG